MSKHDLDETKPEQTGPFWKRQASSIIEAQITRVPLLVQLRAIWHQLQGEREIWPYLIPLLVVVFLGSYRAERKNLRVQSNEDPS